jgi:hypothetical protein
MERITYYCDKCESKADTLERVGELDVCEYCAGDVKALIVYLPNDGEAFNATHVSQHGWNGFHVPTFSYDEALRVLRHVRDTYGSVQIFEVDVWGDVWDKITYADISADEIVTLKPDAHGGYVFAGWVWEFKIERD